MSAQNPQINELMSAHLQRLLTAQAQGFAAGDRGEVEPYEAVPAQVLDPKLAWDEAISVFSAEKLSAPREWPQMILAADSAVAIAFAAGNFPQMVRDLPRLARAATQPTPPIEKCDPVNVEDIGDWLDDTSNSDSIARRLLAAGILRLARQFDRAEKLLDFQPAGLSQKEAAAWGNEQAALLWHRGRHSDAMKLWQGLLETPAVLFNRGMAALFAGDKSAARRDLASAVAAIPDSSGWHHLGRLYLALAQS